MTKTTRSISQVRFSALVVAFVVAASGTNAFARKRAGVPKLEGQQEAVVRKVVMKVLKAHGYDLAKSQEMESALQSTGAQLESDEGYQKVSKELALSVIVNGGVGKKRAKLVVHDGRAGNVLGDAAFPGTNPRKIAADVAKTFWAKLGPAIEKGEVPSNAKTPQKVAAESPEDDENAPEPGEDKAEASEKTTAEPEASNSRESRRGESESGPRRKKARAAESEENVVAEESSSEGSTSPYPSLEITAAPVGINRSLAFNKPLPANSLRPYTLPLGAAISASAVWYPLTSVIGGALGNLGIEGGIEQAFGITSTLPAEGGGPFAGGAKFGTVVHQFEGGLRYRIPLSANQMWLSVTGGEQAFVFQTSDPNASRANLNDLPDVIYQYIRPGAGARFELATDLSLSLGAGFRYITNGGGKQMGQFFPHRTVYGADVSAYLSYRIAPSWEVRAGGEWRQYGFSMHSTQADLSAFQQGGTPIRVAGGAVDRYLSGTVGIAFLLGGSSRPVAEEAAAPSEEKRAGKKDAEDKGGGDTKKDDSDDDGGDDSK